MEEMYMNAEYEKSVHSRPSTNQTGPRSSERKLYGAVVLCLGLLSLFLLAGLIDLSVHYHNSECGAAAEPYTIKADLTADLQASDNKLSSLTEERDQLKANLAEMTEEKDQLKTNLAEMTEERDQLKTDLAEMTEERDQLKTNLAEMTEERDQLKTDLAEMTEERDQLKTNLAETSRKWIRLESLCIQNKTCPEGWKKFSFSCYFLSTESDSWTKGREDCRNRGADLVVIDSDEEQTFLTKFAKDKSWIGLNDKDQEGNWKWVDGSPLTLRYWSTWQPDNGNGDPEWGEEDCVHISVYESWNDRSCETSMLWICEKSLLSLDVQEKNN